MLFGVYRNISENPPYRNRSSDRPRHTIIISYIIISKIITIKDFVAEHTGPITSSADWHKPKIPLTLTWQLGQEKTDNHPFLATAMELIYVRNASTIRSHTPFLTLRWYRKVQEIAVIRWNHIGDFLRSVSASTNTKLDHSPFRPLRWERGPDYLL